MSSDRFEDVDKTRMIDARERIRHRKGGPGLTAQWFEPVCVPGYVSFSSLNVSWLLRKFCPSPSGPEHLLPVHGGQTSNVSSDRLLNERSLSGIFGIFLKRSHTCHSNGDGGRKGDIYLGGGNCGNFPISDIRSLCSML